jgi:hypothetical protein
MYDGPAAAAATTTVGAVVLAEVAPAVASLPQTGWNVLLAANLAVLVFTSGLLVSLFGRHTGAPGRS